MNSLRTLALIPLLALAAFPAAAAEGGAPPAAAPTTAPVTDEDPYVGDPVEVTAEQRAERAFRTVQIGLERGRSNRPEDAEVVVCERSAAIGSHRTMIRCATNGHWNQLSADSLRLMGGAARSLAAGTPKSKAEDSMVISLSGSDYARLEKRFGKLASGVTANR